MKPQSPKILTKSFVPLLMTLATLAAGPAALADGTGGGNADPTGQVELANMEREVNVDLRLSLRSRDSSELVQYVPSINQWCEQIVTYLNRWLKRANIRKQHGQTIVANQIMEMALKKSVEQIQLDRTMASPLTLRLLKRGIGIAMMLEQQLSPQEEQVTLTVFNFLNDYIRFVIEQASNLDRSRVIPYFYTYGGCYEHCPEGFDLIDFESAYLEAAAEQLNFPIKYFTKIKMRNGKPSYESRGNPKVFVYLARMLAEGVSEDISTTLQAYAEACTIQDLNALAESLPNPSETSKDFLDYGDQTDEVAQQLATIGKRLRAHECRAPILHASK